MFLIYIASEWDIPRYNSDTSSTEVQLESGTRILSYETGRTWGVRVTIISDGALKLHADSAIGKEARKKMLIEYRGLFP
jgi:enoyl-[acyl-carrier-protein] reductase (NADH)